MAKKKSAQQQRRGPSPVRHDSPDPLLQEADAQTRAIMRAETYKRIAYSGIAIGAILIGWGFFGGGTRAWGITGIVVLVISIPMSIFLYLGVRNGKKNVDRILAEYSRRHGQSPQTREEINSQIMGETPRIITKATESLNNHARKKAREAAKKN